MSRDQQIQHARAARERASVSNPLSAHLDWALAELEAAPELPPLPDPLAMLAALQRAIRDPGSVIARPECPGTPGGTVPAHVWQARAVMAVIHPWLPPARPAAYTPPEPVPRRGHPGIEIVDSRWWTPAPPASGGSFHDPGGHIGAVLCRDTLTGGYGAFIGRVPGRHMDNEMQLLAEWGARLHPTAGRAIFPHAAAGKWKGDDD